MQRPRAFWRESARGYKTSWMAIVQEAEGHAGCGPVDEAPAEPPERVEHRRRGEVGRPRRGVRTQSEEIIEVVRPARGEEPRARRDDEVSPQELTPQRAHQGADRPRRRRVGRDAHEEADGAVPGGVVGVGRGGHEEEGRERARGEAPGRQEEVVVALREQRLRAG